MSGQCEALAKCERATELPQDTEMGEPCADASDGEKAGVKLGKMLRFTHEPFWRSKAAAGESQSVLFKMRSSGVETITEAFQHSSPAEIALQILGGHPREPLPASTGFTIPSICIPRSATDYPTCMRAKGNTRIGLRL